MGITSFICPFCFKESGIIQLKFRCSNPNCINVPDNEMINYVTFGNNTSNTFIEGKTTFSASADVKNIPRIGICPECRKETGIYVCPKCHNAIPESVLKEKNYVFSIVGARATGKSHFIAVLINELRNRLGMELNYNIEPFDDTLVRYQDEYYNRIYRANQTLDLTSTFTQNILNGKGKPLIFTFSKNFFGFVKNITIAFYDAAGEDLQQLQNMTISNMNIAHSSGIIFLIDPTKTPEIAKHINSENIKRSAGGVDYKDAIMSTEQVLANMRTMINTYNNQENRAIKIPTAIVLSKSDVIENISGISADSNMFKNSPHKGAFYKNDSDIVNEEVLGLLQQLGANHLIQSVKTNYSKYRFFAMSALGKENAPDEYGNIQTPEPRRIEDALLWLMAENHLIKTSYSKVENI